MNLRVLKPRSQLTSFIGTPYSIRLLHISQYSPEMTKQKSQRGYASQVRTRHSWFKGTYVVYVYEAITGIPVSVSLAPSRVPFEVVVTATN